MRCSCDPFTLYYRVEACCSNDRVKPQVAHRSPVQTQVASLATQLHQVCGLVADFERQFRHRSELAGEIARKLWALTSQCDRLNRTMLASDAASQTQADHAVTSPDGVPLSRSELALFRATKR